MEKCQKCRPSHQQEATGLLPTHITGNGELPVVKVTDKWTVQSPFRSILNGPPASKRMTAEMEKNVRTWAGINQAQSIGFLHEISQTIRVHFRQHNARQFESQCNMHHFNVGDSLSHQSDTVVLKLQANKSLAKTFGRRYTRIYIACLRAGLGEKCVITEMHNTDAGMALRRLDLESKATKVSGNRQISRARELLGENGQWLYIRSGAGGAHGTFGANETVLNKCSFVKQGCKFFIGIGLV